MTKKIPSFIIVSLLSCSFAGSAWATAELPPALETTTDSTTATSESTPESTTTESTDTPVPTLYTVSDETLTTTEAPTTATPTATKSFEDFADVPVDYPEYTPIIVLRYQGLLKGYEDNTFHPDQPLNRVEALKLVFEAAAIEISNGVAPANFTDTEAMAWYSGYLNKALFLEVVSGYPDGSFQPSKSVNTVEFLKMLLLAQKVDLSNTNLNQIPYADVMPGQWYTKYVNYAKINDLLKTGEDNKIYPDAPLTRARAADIIYRFRNMKAKPTGTSTSSTTTTTTSATVIPVKDFALYVSSAYKIAFQYPKTWYYSAFVEKLDPTDIAIYGFGPEDLSTNPPLVNLELLPDLADFQTNLVHNGFSYLREEGTDDTVKLSAKINGSSRIYRISGPHEQETNMLTMLESLTADIEGLESYNPAVSAATTTDTTTPATTPAATAETTTSATTTEASAENVTVPE